MAFNTRNPVEPNGSTDPRDLKDNAAIIDKLVNSSDLTWLGRLGKTLKTWAGMTAEHNAAQVQRSAEFQQFLQSSGYEVPVPYAPGISITRTTQTVVYNGELYRPKEASLPFVTTTFPADSEKWIANGDNSLRQMLASHSGSASVGFQQRGANASFRDQQSKDRETLSLPDYGGAPNTDNTTAVAAALVECRASKDRRVLVPAGQNNTGIVSNPTGVTFQGGDLVETPNPADSSTFDILSSYADRLSYQLGNEYLYALHNEISSHNSVKIMMVGDSTVVGVNSVAPYTPAGVLSDQGLDRGLVGILINNLAVSGSASPQWDTSQIIADTSTHCLIVGYGTNDPAAGDEEAFFNNMSAKLAAVRAARNVQSLTIILKGANSTNDWVNGRSQLWCERIASVYRKLARMYQCYFFDTYAFLRDSKNAAHLWMDTLPYGSPPVDTHIHPNNFGNMWIWGELARNIFPDNLSQRMANNYRNIAASHTMLTALAPPENMPYGRAIYRTASTDWPSDGMVVSEKHADGIVTQEVTPFNRSITKVHRRNSLTSAPGAWTLFTGAGYNLTLQNGWSNFDAPNWMVAQLIIEESGFISARGLLRPGTLVANTVLFSVFSAVPNGAPILGEVFQLSCNTGSIRVVVGIGGNVSIKEVSGTPTEVSLSGMRWMPT